MIIESAVRPEHAADKRLTVPPTPDVHRIAHEVVTHLARSGTLCTATPGNTVRTELTAVTRICLGWMIQRLSGEPPARRLDRLEAAAAGWARDEVPIETVLHAAHEGLKAGLELLIPRGGRTSGIDITTAITASIELLGLITSTVSKTYVRELKSVADEHHTSVHTVTSALLAGHTATAGESGIPIAERYFVLALAVPAHPDENDPRLDRQVVARRKLRRLQSALATQLGHGALTLLSVDGGTILVPTDACTETGIDELVQQLSAATSVDITATVVAAAAGEIPAATRHAHELLDIVEQLGLEPRVHRLTELALEYQLTRPGAGHTRLDRLLEPLDDHPELLQTLQTYLATDRNRTRAARQLHVHPNTVDYRMQRIGNLTGLDPTDSRTWWYLYSALIARRSRASCIA
ncbi:PucR family transcriptional regulator [Nocardia flavorosea]|uniref:PucR family transcriptional regulator n=1 Tax=Nocardia flavorosea TaxID=53429 RepID=UPI0024548D65|nr:helix-turn-helix domain-containing protein [Nocardia flavorosea]